MLLSIYKSITQDDIRKKHPLATGKIRKEYMELLPEYSENTRKIMEAAGGKLLSVFFTEESILGENTPEAKAIMVFPDSESINSMVESEEYKKGIPTREKCFL